MIFSPAVAGALPALFARVGGPRVAIFHDAIALQLPDLTPPKSVARSKDGDSLAAVLVHDQLGQLRLLYPMVGQDT